MRHSVITLMCAIGLSTQAFGEDKNATEYEKAAMLDGESHDSLKSFQLAG